MRSCCFSVAAYFMSGTPLLAGLSSSPISYQHLSPQGQRVLHRAARWVSHARSPILIAPWPFLKKMVDTPSTLTVHGVFISKKKFRRRPGQAFKVKHHSFFFCSVQLIFFALPSRSPPEVTRIRGHIAGAPPPSLRRHVP